LKNLSGRKFFQNRFPLAIVAGLLLATSFPKIGIAGFAWVAPGLMLAAAIGKRRAESFRLGYVAGLTHYLTSLYWLLFIPYRWNGIPLGPAIGWIALSAYLALFPATWVWLCLEILRPKSKAQTPVAWLSTISETSWITRTLWTFSCAAIWVAAEMLISRLLGGFPWNLLSASQHRIVPLIQIASVIGAYGISFLVVWTSASLLCAAALILRKPNVRSVWVTEMIFPMLAVAVTFAFGMHRLGRLPQPDQELRVTVVQPAIPQTLIWDESEDMNRFQSLLRLSEQALTNETDLLIWPEAGIPKPLRYFDEIRDPVLELARSNRVWMIVGSDDAELGQNSAGAEVTNFFNSSFLVSPTGDIVASYRKRNLVMFGEYVPFTRWLPFMKWFTPVDQGYTGGDKPAVFRIIRNPPSKVQSAAPAGETLDFGLWTLDSSPLICFEDVFPQVAREAASENVDLLVNITNDGWFGESAAQWQQAASACFRAVENNVPLVRCANSGLTCWVDEAGRFREIFQDASGSVYGPGSATFHIPITAHHHSTFYNRHGDWFGWSCAAFSFLAIGVKYSLKSDTRAH
jgi:apolipoprotein N-acyltransferase